VKPSQSKKTVSVERLPEEDLEYQANHHEFARWASTNPLLINMSLNFRSEYTKQVQEGRAKAGKEGKNGKKQVIDPVGPQRNLAVNNTTTPLSRLDRQLAKSGSGTYVENLATFRAAGREPEWIVEVTRLPAEATPTTAILSTCIKVLLPFDGYSLTCRSRVH
jgi:hypothetical protein